MRELLQSADGQAPMSPGILQLLAGTPQAVGGNPARATASAAAAAAAATRGVGAVAAASGAGKSAAADAGRREAEPSVGCSGVNSGGGCGDPNSGGGSKCPQLGSGLGGRSAGIRTADVGEAGAGEPTSVELSTQATSGVKLRLRKLNLVRPSCGCPTTNPGEVARLRAAIVVAAAPKVSPASASCRGTLPRRRLPSRGPSATRAAADSSSELPSERDRALSSSEARKPPNEHCCGATGGVNDPPWPSMPVTETSRICEQLGLIHSSLSFPGGSASPKLPAS